VTASDSSAPLVSLIMLAYRQEALVGDALRGALAQDYPNLEIVASDDCSPDGTFDEMRRVADAYSGPHKVIVNRTERNLGIFPHLYEAIALSGGGLIVGAAGDDVSYPHRVSRLAERWQQTDADALYSDWDVIGADGELVSRGRPKLAPFVDAGAYFPRRQLEQIAGVTSAYSRRVFEAVRVPETIDYAEDFFFTLLLALRSRRIEYIDERLVAYRTHGSSLTHFPGAMGTAEREASVERLSERLVPVLRYFERAATTGEGIAPDWGEPAEVDLARLRADIRFFGLRARWSQLGFFGRLRAITAASSPGQLAWAAPRLFGLGGLGALKRVRAAGLAVLPARR